MKVLTFHRFQEADHYNGARSVVIRAEGKQDPLSQWINGIRKRKGLNVAAVALANKNARILWVLCKRPANSSVI